MMPPHSLIVYSDLYFVCRGSPLALGVPLFGWVPFLAGSGLFALVGSRWPVLGSVWVPLAGSGRGLVRGNPMVSETPGTLFLFA